MPAIAGQIPKHSFTFVYLTAPMARPYTPLSLGRRLRETHTRVVLCLLGGGVLLAGLMASDAPGVGFVAALAVWLQLLVLLAA